MHHRYYLVPLSIALTCIGLQWAGEQWTLLLRYDRAAIVYGEWWRMLTAHLVHLGWNHLWLNMASVTLLTWLFADLIKPTWLIALVALMNGGISLCFLWLMPDLLWYVGFSGTLYGLFVMGILRLWDEHRLLWSAVLIGVAARMAWEYVQGVAASTEAMIGGTVLVESHLFGILIGVIMCVCIYFYNRRLREE